MPDSHALELAQKLLENEKVKLTGLGSRDALRLEAGLCLYGNDLNEDITPIEAGLKWTIGQRRRDACDFIGGEVRVLIVGIIKMHASQGYVRMEQF